MPMLRAHLSSQLTKLLPRRTDRFAIAFSGGGDSTALVHALKNHPQRGPVFIVDHALRIGSAQEAVMAKSFAQDCGYETHILTWVHDGPTTGLQDKARRARYGLMGEACRQLGVAYLLTAHSQDDQAETLLMRYDKKTDWRGAAGISSVSYAPVWPELAQINICRPLLEVSRQDLREYNRAHRLAWSEDPSNENRDFSRIRARDYLSSRQTLKSNLIETACLISQGVLWEKENMRDELSLASFGPAGDVTFPTLPSLELFCLSMRCVGGGGASISRSRLKKLYQQMRSGETSSITFLGAKAVQENAGVILSRDRIAVTGRKGNQDIKPRAITLPLTSQPQIWDGRFLVSTLQEGYAIRANYGLKLPKSKRLKAELSSLHKSVRPTCPVIIYENKAFWPVELTGIKINNLVKSRLDAALC